ncbi:receptor-type guanylate cyclase gcy-28-like [Paramacrobiotus metropolitanus]|uniref:receptor-type guanylate cyclase gcy-28-like n=1 Tax=Paramacrobiotus metropolitanus TaxID=2943436 RepID=UPI002445A05B|nr:receptor-type guanylate cyclase gcy-28-like [Paramacrobiotus metropolitanus]
MHCYPWFGFSLSVNVIYVCFLSLLLGRHFALDTNSNITTLTICVILERGSREILTNYDKVGAGIDMGLDYVHDDILPPEIRLRKVYRDAGDSCSVSQMQKAALEAMSLMREGIQCDLYLGPGCVEAVIDICNIAAFTGTPVISFPTGGITSATNPRHTFPMLIRMSFRLQAISDTIIIILKTLSMVHTHVLVDMSVGFHVSLSMILYERLRAAGNTDYLRYNKYEYLEVNVTDREIRRHLRSLSLSSRAVILLCGGVLTRRIMFLASQLGMTSGDYLYIATELFESYYWGIFTWRGDEEKEDQILRAYDSLLLIAMDEMANNYYKIFKDVFLERAESDYGYNFQTEGPFQIDPADATVAAMFDSIVLYASAVRAVSEAGENIKNYSAILDAMKGKTYESPITSKISMDASGDRVRRFYVQDILPQGQYDNVLEINGTSLEVTVNGGFHWPGSGQPPVDVPFCGFDGNDPKCSKAFRNAVIIGSVLAVFSVFCGISTGRWYYKRHAKKNPFWWRISPDELDVVPAHRPTTVSTAEVPQLKNSNESLDSINEKPQFQPVSLVADYRGVRVRLVQCPEKMYRPSHAVVRDLNIIKSLHHNNLLKFIGISLDEQGYCQYCLEEQSEKGSLFDLIAHETHIIDEVFKLSFIRDIVQGMQYLHSTVVTSHGFLRSSICHVNSKFMVRLSDYGLSQLRPHADLLPPKMSEDTQRDYYTLLYRAPELLRVIMSRKGTQKGGHFERRGSVTID